jgi:hypothetical protein
MKKMICLLVIALMIASVAFAAPAMKITAKDLPGLKGTWEGILGFGVGEQGTSPAKLEILNDTVPVKVRLTVTNVPQQLATQIGVKEGQNVYEGEGVITTQGTLFFTGPQKNFFEVSQTAKDKIHLWYIYNVLKGDGTLKKKK